MKRFNFDEFLWLIVLVVLNLSIIYLIFTGKINFYIGKKMIKYMYITTLIISIITIFQLKNVFTSKGNDNLKIKLLPIVLTLILVVISINKQETFKHIELDREIIDNKTRNIDIKTLYEHEPDYNSIEDNSKDESIFNQTTKENLKNKINITQNKEQNILIVNENNPLILEDIKVNPKKYIGRKLEIHGFICKEGYLNENQFIIGRIVMTCCAADLRVVGIIGEYNKACELKENDKISASGTISSSTIKDNNNVSHRVPIIVIEKLKVEN